MTHLTVELHDANYEYLRRTAAASGSEPAAVLCDILSDRSKRAALDRLATVVREAEASGPVVEATPDFWRERFRRLGKPA